MSPEKMTNIPWDAVKLLMGLALITFSGGNLWMVGGGIGLVAGELLFNKSN